MTHDKLPVPLVALLAALCCCDESAREAEFSLLADDIPAGTLLGITSMGSEALFVGGQLDGSEGILVRYDGTSICYEEAVASRPLWWIHSAREGEFYAVGERGTIVHSLDGVRTDESVDTDATLFGVFDAGDQVIAVGGDVFGSGLGEVWIREGGSWSLLRGDLPGVAFKVWDRWIVGDGIAYHLTDDPTPILEERFPPDGARLTTVVGRNDDEVFAVGGLGSPVLLAWNGASWENVDIDPGCADMALNGVFTEPGESVWVAGFFGRMGELRADGTWNCAVSPPTFETFHVVGKHGDELLFAGGNFLEQGGNYGTIARYGEANEALTATACGAR